MIPTPVMSRSQALQLGATRYFTGRPCVHGHIAQRMTSSKSCLTCLRARKAGYQAKNREKINAHDRARYATDEKARDRKKAATAAWVKRNKEAVVSHKKNYVDRNRAKVRAANRRWSSKNTAKKAAYAANRRAAKAHRTPLWLTDEDFWIMDEVYDLAAARSKATGVPHQVDHIIPLQGRIVSGLHVPSNLQILTAHENATKHNQYAA